MFLSHRVDESGGPAHTLLRFCYLPPRSIVHRQPETRSNHEIWSFFTIGVAALVVSAEQQFAITAALQCKTSPDQMTYHPWIVVDDASLDHAFEHQPFIFQPDHLSKIRWRRAAGNDVRSELSTCITARAKLMQAIPVAKACVSLVLSPASKTFQTETRDLGTHLSSEFQRSLVRW
jgi:hypothetical protein